MRLCLFIRGWISGLWNSWKEIHQAYLFSEFSIKVFLVCFFYQFPHSMDQTTKNEMRESPSSMGHVTFFMSSHPSMASYEKTCEKRNVSRREFLKRSCVCIRGVLSGNWGQIFIIIWSLVNYFDIARLLWFCLIIMELLNNLDIAWLSWYGLIFLTLLNYYRTV